MPRSARNLATLLVFVLGLAVVPHRVCERDGDAFFDGDPVMVDALARTVARWTGEPQTSEAPRGQQADAGGIAGQELAASSFQTGSRRFDGEWLFGTYMMAAMGFGQVALATDAAARRAESLARMERCLDALLSPAARAFDGEAWSLDALASLDASPGSPGDRGHVAYLGYAGLALGLHRVLVPISRFDALHDRLAAALARRFDASPGGLVETYPGEMYPVDNAAALGALALHAKATGAARAPALRRGLEALRAPGVRPSAGLLAQAADPQNAAGRDPGRGSGTALAVYFVAYADPALAADLYRALRQELYRTVLGFGVVLEHPPTAAASHGRTDIDSGPVIGGFGVSATGFAIGASRIREDREAFVALHATAHLFGAPFDEGETRSRTYATGGPLGDAILFAMLTAPRPATLARVVDLAALQEKT